MTRRPDDARDAGFTLPELLISMVILSFIVGAIGFALTVVLRNTRATAERTVSNLGAQALTAWFAGDVEGADATGAGTDPAATTGCPDDDPGANVLLLPRADGLGVVSYRLVADDTGGYELWRVLCVDGVRRRNVVVQGVTDPAQVVVTRRPADEAAPFDTVSMRVTTGDVLPTSVEVTGSPRTRDVPEPCGLASATPQSQAVTGAGQLLVDMVFSVHTAGDCAGPVTLTVPTGGSPATAAVTLSPVPGDDHAYTGIVARGGTWTTGIKTVSVADGRGPIGRFPLLLSTQPCTISTSLPASLVYKPGGSAVPFTVTTTGACGSLSITTASGGTNPLPATTLAQTAPGTWTANLPGDHLTWSPGRKTINVLQGGANIGTTAIEAIPAPCRLTNGTTAVPPRIDSTGQLTGNLGVTVTTDGVCGRIGLSIPTGGGPQDPYVVNPLAGGPITWTTTIPRPGQTWTVGLRNATVTNDDQVLGTFPFDLREVCSMIGNGPSSIAVGSDGRVLVATTFTVRTRGSCGTVTLRLNTGGSPGTLDRTLLPGVNQYTTVVQPWETTWAPNSTQTMTAANDGATLGSWNVTVTQPCAVLAGPKQILVSASSPKRVPQDTPISVTTSGPCSQPISVRFATGSGPVDPLPVALSPAGGGVYNGVIRPTDAVWTVDVTTPRTARVYSGSAEIGSFLYVVSDCSVVSFDGTIGLSGNRVSGGERITYRTNGGSACRTNTMTVSFTPAGSTQVQQLPTTPNPLPDWRTSTLGGLAWSRGQGPVTVSVYNSVNVFDESTLAGQFQVQGS